MKNKEKFSFSTEFQLEVLRYIIRDPEGNLALRRIKPSYLTLIEHSLIAEGLVKFLKKNKRIPSLPVLKETLKDLLETSQYIDLVTKDDVPSIYRLVDDLYSNPLKDSDIIKEKIYSFSAYVEMKSLMESVDLTSFDQYSEVQNKIASIVQRSKPSKEEEPIFLVKDVIDRQFQRQANPSVLPCPFRQLNELTNGGGFPRGSVIVLLDKAKAKKTFSLINVARGYLAMKRNVLYIDTENGKNEIMGRIVQSTMSKSKKEMMSGEYDKREQQQVRKYKRLGVECIVERVPAMIADVNTIKDKILQIKQKYGIDIHVLMLDYAGKLASTNKDEGDFERISNTYIEVQELSLELGLDAVWTAHHVTREGSKHKETRYEENDISGAIAIVRNAQCIIGLNSTPEEEENNVQRMEIVVQRDGKPHGRALFNLNVDNQRMVEFTKQQRELYEKEYGEKLEASFKKKGGGFKNPNSKPKSEGNGDI